MRSRSLTTRQRLTLLLTCSIRSRRWCSTWFAPSVAYEVEFHKIGHDYQTRALLLEEQVQVEEGSLLGHSFA